MLPPHKTYVEAFAGSAAVMFEKEPSPVEVINDLDPEIAGAYRLIKRLSKKDLARLRRKSWVGDETTFKRLYDSKPQNDVDRLYRFLYVSHFSYGRLRSRSFSPAAKGTTAKTIQRLEKFGPRLQKVQVFNSDFEKVIRQFDGPDTLFFLDPPYAGHNVKVGESDFDEERFYSLLKSLKGKWLVTYGVRGKLPGLLKGGGYDIKQFRTPRTIRAMRGVGGPKMLVQIIATNFPAVKKGLGDDDSLELSEWIPEPGQAVAASDPQPTPVELAQFTKQIPIIKGIDPDDERYVLGIVLEPEVVDAQGDIYSVEEIRQAAHRFMEEFGGLGLMHRLQVNGQVRILESYLAPVDLQIGDIQVRQGTWLFAVRILSDVLWGQIKDGALSGFSIGGSARRAPESAAGTETPADIQEAG